MQIVKTERLILQEFTINDAKFIVTLLNSPGWLRFIGDRGIKTVDDARKYITEKLIGSYAKNGFGLYCILLKEKNIPIGMCGLVKREGLEDVDIGFALAPGFERKGFAFEAATATINYAEKTLKLPRLVAITSPDNISSINLLKKLNFSFVKKILMPNDEEELMLFVSC